MNIVILNHLPPGDLYLLLPLSYILHCMAPILTAGFQLSPISF